MPTLVSRYTHGLGDVQAEELGKAAGDF